MKVDGYQAATVDRKYAKALELLERALKIERSLLNADDLRLAETHNLLGFVASLSGDNLLAVQHYKEVVRIREKTLGDNPLTGESLRALCGAFALLGQERPNLSYFERQWQVFSKTQGPEAPNSVLALESLASTLGKLGDYGTELTYRQELLRIARKIHGVESLEAAKALKSLARSYSFLGNNSLAVAASIEALEIYKKQRGLDHLDTAEAFDRAGNWYQRRRSRECSRRILFVRTKSDKGFCCESTQRRPMRSSCCCRSTKPRRFTFGA